MARYEESSDGQLVEIVWLGRGVEKVEQRTGSDYYDNESSGDPEGTVEVGLLVKDLAEGPKGDGRSHPREDLLLLHIEVVPE